MSLICMLPFDMAVFDETGQPNGLLHDILRMAQDGLLCTGGLFFSSFSFFFFSFCFLLLYPHISSRAFAQTSRRMAQPCWPRAWLCDPTPRRPFCRTSSTGPWPACSLTVKPRGSLACLLSNRVRSNRRPSRGPKRHREVRRLAGCGHGVQAGTGQARASAAPR